MFPLKGSRRITDVTDGISSTVMVVEAEEAVEWTRPDDLVYDPKKPLPKLGGHNPGGTQVIFADRTVKLLPATLPEKTWRMLIEINDGNVIPSLDR